METKTVEEFIAEKAEAFKNFKDLAIRNMEGYELMVPLAEAWEAKNYADEYEGMIRSADIRIRDNFAGVNVHIWLDKEDSIEKEVNLFAEEIEDVLFENGFKFLGDDEYVEGEWIKKTYANRESGGCIHIFFHYGGSHKCRLVETGETVPVFERVCD